jgi:hypothetical protein
MKFRRVPGNPARALRHLAQLSRRYFELTSYGPLAGHADMTGSTVMVLRAMLDVDECRIRVDRHTRPSMALSSDNLHKWMRQADIDERTKPGKSTSDSAEMHELRRRACAPRLPQSLESFNWDSSNPAAGGTGHIHDADPAPGGPFQVAFTGMNAAGPHTTHRLSGIRALGCRP